TDPAWRLAQTGRVVKWVCPLTTWCPDKAQGRVLWLDRNPEEQARSQVKLAVACGARWNDPGRMAQKIAAHITDHTTLAVALAGEQGPVERLAFEDLLADPLDAAKRLASFFRPLAVLDVTAAAGVVRPRTPDCRPDLEVDVGKLRLELFSHG
ncbi:hypothetical protein LHP98_17145, partial [Rhodobacter sp. Har01]|uniref:hypothetical protein n=1 Tax=Rhodobacter sp. Har01 TaxID=2883999 RepID=UPI001D0936D1